MMKEMMPEVSYNFFTKMKSKIGLIILQETVHSQQQPNRGYIYPFIVYHSS